MAQFLADLFAAFATVPFISFIIIYVIAYTRTKSKKESIRWAIHITMLLLLFSVSGMIKAITDSTALFWWMIVLLVLIAGVIVFLQWKLRQQINIGKAIRSMWYLGFILFALMYIVLIPIGIVSYYGKM